MLSREWLHFGVCNEEFTVMQFNCLADGLAQSGEFQYASPDELYWSSRWILIQTEINRINPDVLCVQEMNHPEALATFMPDHYMLYCPKLSSPALNCGSPPDGCVMMIRRSLYELIDVQIVYYNTGGEPNSGAIVAAVKDKRNKQGLIFATSHLKAKAAAANEEIRVIQIRQLLSRIKGSRNLLHGYLGGESQPRIILTGDFNSSPDRDVYKTIYTDSEINFHSVYNACFRQSQRDECDKAAFEKPPCAEYSKHEPDFTTYKIRHGEGAKKHTIDYIWLGQSCNEQNKLVVSASWSLPTTQDIGERGLPCEKYPSDHLAIAAKFGWCTLV